MPGPRRQVDPEAELAAWETTFETGKDYFLTLREVGLKSEPGKPVPTEQARDAWQRLGALFMQRRRPSVHRASPWALEEFGEPPIGA
jgi:hypothetical protein